MFRFAAAGALSVGLMAAACTPQTPGADRPDAGDGGDAGAPGDATLTVEFRSSRPIPGDAGGPWNATVSHAHADLSDLRAIADSGVVTAAALSLDWNAELGPTPLVFGGAPPGIYSELAASMDGYGVRGTVEIDGIPTPFEISDTPQPPIGLGVNLHGLELPVGGSESVRVDIDFRRLIDKISWNDVPAAPDGTLRVDADSPQIDSVRDEADDIFGDDD